MCFVGVHKGLHYLDFDTIEGVKIPIFCGKWSCKDCGPKKKGLLFSRIMNGEIAQKALRNGFRSKYAIKLLTLTCPGREYRDTHTIQEAYQDMVVAYDKLIRALKKYWGSFHYIRVREPQRDGYPHFHVLLVGDNIAPKGVLGHIRSLWVHEYGMGNIDIKTSKKAQSFKSAILYILKYITKGASRNTEDYKGLRLFTVSRNSLEPMRTKEKRHWLKHKFEFGIPGDGNQDFKKWEFSLLDKERKVPDEFKDLWKMFIEFIHERNKVKILEDSGGNDYDIFFED